MYTNGFIILVSNNLCLPCKTSTESPVVGLQPTSPELFLTLGNDTRNWWTMCSDLGHKI